MLKPDCGQWDELCCEKSCDNCIEKSRVMRRDARHSRLAGSAPVLMVLPSGIALAPISCGRQQVAQMAQGVF